MSLVPSPFSRLASATVSGLVSIVAQTFAGVKTFTSAIIASAGIQLATALYNTNGSGSTDLCIKEGTSVADGTVNASAKIWTLRTGIGGTEVEYGYFQKGFGFVIDGKNVNNQFSISVINSGIGTTGYSYTIAGGGSGTWGNTGGYASIGLLNTNRTMFFIVNGNAYDGAPQAFYFRNQSGNAALCVARFDATSGQTGSWWEAGPSGTPVGALTAAGMLSQQGTDFGGSPGAQAINKPIGRCAIAAGASSVVITNSLAVAGMHCVFSPHARDATCKELIAVVTNGFITFSGTANATAAIPISFRLSGIL